MKITAMLVFWDEPATRLYRWGRSVARLADHVVAADGPFALYPHTETRSTDVAIHALKQGVRDAGATIDLIPGREWAGQVAKRDAVIQACAPTDWVFWMDADETIAECDIEAIRTELEQTEAEAVQVRRLTPPNDNARWEPDSTLDEKEGAEQLFARIYRYLDDMHVVHRHWVYVGKRKDGTPIYYWSEAAGYKMAATAPLEARLLFHHHQTWRSDAYRERQLAYREAMEAQVRSQGQES